MKRHCIVGLLVVGLVLPLWSAGAQEAEGKHPSRFGVVEAYYRPAEAVQLGAGWERIIFEWAQFQPNNPNEFNTSVIPEEWLINARDAGREVIGLLKNTPRWASDSHELGAPPYGLDLSIDDPNNLWAAFVKRVVIYYGQKWNIHHWIIYNEPDLRPGESAWWEFDGNVEDYYKMVKVAYLAAKRVDPDAVIHLAGMAWWVDVVAGRQPYLKRFLEAALDDLEAYDNGFFFDVATVHIYFGTENVWSVILQVKSILWHYGLDEKAIWVDETNALPTIDPYTPVSNPMFAVSLEQQSDFIVQAAALSLAAQVERFAIYRLYDDHFVPGQTEPWGLIRADGSLRPGFLTYQTVINTFSSTVRAHRFFSQRSTLVTLEQPGQTVYVMWARNTDPVRFHVWSASGDETATQISVLGTPTTLTPATVEGVEDWWYVLDAPGAVKDSLSNKVVVEGSPIILVATGGPRAVWVEVDGLQWRLR